METQTKVTLTDGAVSLPIEYNNWIIDWERTGYSRDKYQFVHKNYDGPEDNRIGNGSTLEDCYNEIDNREEDYRNTLLNKAYLKVYKHKHGQLAFGNSDPELWQDLNQLTNEQLWNI